MIIEYMEVVELPDGSETHHMYQCDREDFARYMLRKPEAVKTLFVVVHKRAQSIEMWKWTRSNGWLKYEPPLQPQQLHFSEAEGRK